MTHEAGIPIGEAWTNPHPADFERIARIAQEKLLLCPTQPCYPGPHKHYPDWLSETVITVSCRPADGSKCGRHRRSWTVGDLLDAWRAGR